MKEGKDIQKIRKLSMKNKNNKEKANGDKISTWSWECFGHLRWFWILMRKWETNNEKIKWIKSKTSFEKLIKKEKNRIWFLKSVFFAIHISC